MRRLIGTKSIKWETDAEPHEQTPEDCHQIYMLSTCPSYIDASPKRVIFRYHRPARLRLSGLLIATRLANGSVSPPGGSPGTYKVLLSLARITVTSISKDILHQHCDTKPLLPFLPLSSPLFAQSFSLRNGASDTYSPVRGQQSGNIQRDHDSRSPHV